MALSQAVDSAHEALAIAMRGRKIKVVLRWPVRQGRDDGRWLRHHLRHEDAHSFSKTFRASSEAAEFKKSLKLPAGSIAKAVADGAFFVVTQNGQQWYPSFFTDPTLKRRQLIAVTRLLKDLNGFAKWQFFVTGKGSLGGLTPLEALRQGDLRQVKATAQGASER